MTKICLVILSFYLMACSSVTPHSPTLEQDSLPACRQPAQANSLNLRLVPQELYGEEVMALLNSVTSQTPDINILQFNFFTDNAGDSYPKSIAKKLIEIKKQFPNVKIRVALESRKDLNATDGKGAAQRNAKTKKLLQAARITVADVYGAGANGISHTKLVQVGNQVIAGSTNLTQQSTTPSSNNEMNIGVDSTNIANKVREYVDAVCSKPGQPQNLRASDLEIDLLTDQLHFDELITQIRAAQKGDQLGLAMYEFLYRTDKDVQAKQVFQELVSAHQRGAEIQIFLNRAEDLAQQNSLVNLNVAEQLLAAGIQKIYLDPTGKISHSKYFYRISNNEKVALISSVNIYSGDFNDNHQISWLVKDSNLVETLSYYYKQQVAYDSVLLTRLPADPQTRSRYHNVNGKPVWNAVNSPQRMLRFWRGFRQDKISIENFRHDVNSKLIPATTDVAQGRGLNAYLPSFYSQQKPEFIPDEVAIIDYVDSESYDAIRTTAPGRDYGPLHFTEGLFTKQNQAGYQSGSTVAVPYEGQVDIKPPGTAYMLGDLNLNWQSGSVVRRTVFPTHAPLQADAVKEYLESLNKNQDLGLQGAVALVDPQYMILMLNYKNEDAASKGESELSRIEKTQHLSRYEQIRFVSQAPHHTNLTEDIGLSIKFDSKLRSSIENRKIILDEIQESSKSQVHQNSMQIYDSQKVMCKKVLM